MALEGGCVCPATAVPAWLTPTKRVLLALMALLMANHGPVSRGAAATQAANPTCEAATLAAAARTTPSGVTLCDRYRVRSYFTSLAWVNLSPAL